MLKTPRAQPFFSMLLALLAATTPLAVDAYLPAIPEMAVFYQTDIQQVSLSVSVFLIGFALGQLIGGPCSDRVGRRPLVFIGLTGYLLTSFGIAASTQVEQLWLLRLVQAFSGGLCTVNIGAMVRDRYDGQESAKVLSMVMLIMMSAPLLAPAIGATLLKLLNWQSIFFFLAIYAGVALLISAWQLPETHKQREASASWKAVLNDYWHVITHRHAIRYIIAAAFAFSTMFVFISESAYLYINYLGASSELFPFLFGANIIVMMLCNRINISLLKHYQPQQILWLGMGLQCAGTLCFLLLVLLDKTMLYTVLPLMMLSVGCLGFIGANAMSAMLSFFPNTSGTANAVLGTSEFLLGGFLGAVVSALPHNNLWPVAAGMATCAICSLSALWLLKPQHAEAVVQ